MPILNRRFVRFLLLDALVILGLLGIFAAVNHAFVPQTPPLSERILVTPEPSGFDAALKPKADSSSNSIIPKTLRIEQLQDALSDITVVDPSSSLDLKRLRATHTTVTVHKIEMGENYWSLATDNNISINTLIGANPGMPFKASINQPVNILSRKGILHKVEKGETIAGIAALYRAEEKPIDEKIIKDENGITWWHRIHEGDLLYIPGVKAIHMVKEWKDYFDKRGFFGIPFSGWGKGWTSSFGYRTDPITGEQKLHKGMDFKAKYGESVFAAATGKVIFAGVSGGYGNLIQIHHANGYLTYYGHLSKILVKQGHRVRRGELIGKVGATGRVTGPHLHFEIRKNGRAINPLPLI